MFKNVANLHYVMGFVIVLVILYISMRLYIMTNSTRYKVSAEDNLPRVGITILTNHGPLNLDRNMMDHYLNRLKENLEYLSQIIDIDKCEKIRNELVQARESLKNQVVKTQLNEKQKDQMWKERTRLRTRISTISDIMFDNDQNPDSIKSIMMEMILDLETILYMTKIIPSEIESIDVRDVDQVAKLIYEHACMPLEKPHSEEDPKPQNDNFEMPFEDAFFAVHKKRPSSFETFVDFNKHQNLQEHRVGTSSYNPSHKTRKENLSNIRKTSLTLARPEKEKYRPSIARKVAVSKEAKGTDPIRDRIQEAREEFISSQPNRYKPRKNTLVQDYNHLEDSLVILD